MNGLVWQMPFTFKRQYFYDLSQFYLLTPLLSLQPQRHGMELILTADVTENCEGSVSVSAVIGE